MLSTESIWYSPAYLLSQIRTLKSASNQYQFEHSSKYQPYREIRASLVAAASIHLQTGDCTFIQTAKRHDDPPDIRILRIPHNIIKDIPCIVPNDLTTTEEIEVTSYYTSVEKETLHQQLTRTKWRDGYDFKGVVLVETDSESLQKPYPNFSDNMKPLWLIIKKRRSHSGAFFMSMFPEKRTLHINVGKTAAHMRKLNAPDILIMTNHGVRHRKLSTTGQISAVVDTNNEPTRIEI